MRRPATPDHKGWGPYLDNGETIIWQGRPATGIRVRPKQIGMSVFGVFFFGFAVFWTYSAAQSSLLFASFGAPFLTVGAYLLFGQYIWDAYARGLTVYALSNRRAFIAKRALGRSIKTYPITATSSIEYQPGEEAHLYFASQQVRTKNGYTTHKIGFEFIQDGQKVYNVIRDIQFALGDETG